MRRNRSPLLVLAIRDQGITRVITPLSFALVRRPSSSLIPEAFVPLLVASLCRLFALALAQFLLSFFRRLISIVHLFLHLVHQTFQTVLFLEISHQNYIVVVVVFVVVVVVVVIVVVVVVFAVVVVVILIGVFFSSIVSALSLIFRITIFFRT